MDAFLTPDEVQRLTGYKVQKKQIKWLVDNVVRHWVARTGHPVVPRSAIDGNAKADDDDAPFQPRYVA